MLHEFSYLDDLGKCLFPKLLTEHLRHDNPSSVGLKPSKTCYHFLIEMYTGELELDRDEPLQVVSGATQMGELKLRRLYI